MCTLRGSLRLGSRRFYGVMSARNVVGRSFFYFYRVKYLVVRHNFYNFAYNLYVRTVRICVLRTRNEEPQRCDNGLLIKVLALCVAQ